MLSVTLGGIIVVDILHRAKKLLAHGRWFSPGTSVSSTTKTVLHDIAEILLKVALSTIKIKSNHLY
jgi:methylmalonyl-CoA mutase cobalamin-binding subunit